MDIFDDNIDNLIKKFFLKNIENDLFIEAVEILSNVLDRLYLNIPDNKRISYGRFYTIKVVSNKLYFKLKENNFKVYDISTELFNLNTDDFRIRPVALGILSLYGLENFENAKKTLPTFKNGATHKHWEARECAASFFQRYIKEYPKEIKSFLVKCVKSDDPNIRRFASESLRPVTHNRWIIKKPEYSISILRHLFKEKMLILGHLLEIILVISRENNQR